MTNSEEQQQLPGTPANAEPEAAKKRLHITFTKENIAKLKKAAIPTLAGCGAAASVLVACLTVGGYDMGVAVVVDGETLCVVQNQALLTDAVAEVQGEVSDALGEPYSLDLAPKYYITLAKSDAFSDENGIRQALQQRMGDIQELTVLKVDGKLIGAVENGEALQSMLDQIKAQYTTGAEGEEITFTKDVSLKTELCRLDKKMSVWDIRNILQSETTVDEIYTAQEGDTFSVIAPRYGMEVSALESLNSDIDEVQPGTAVHVERKEPLLGVCTTITQVYQEEIPYEVQENVDNTKFSTERIIETEGVVGSQTVTARITYLNGVQSGQQVMDTVVNVMPVPEVVTVGTRALPKFNGTFSLPVRGVFTSEYGPRWGEFHLGLDIANVSGTAIHASETGTVIYSGENGTYGLCVMIDHGNGFVTLYGHNSLLEVNVGDKVAKGQEIAKMGSTGNSTGPHCHFEIRISGEHVNPRLYLDNQVAVYDAMNGNLAEDTITEEAPQEEQPAEEAENTETAQPEEIPIINEPAVTVPTYQEEPLPAEEPKQTIAAAEN